MVLTQASPEALAAFARHLTLLEKAGYTIKLVVALSDIQAINLRHQHLTSTEMAQMIRPGLQFMSRSTVPAPPRRFAQDRR
jgi:hypothetical protein